MNLKLIYSITIIDLSLKNPKIQELPENRIFTFVKLFALHKIVSDCFFRLDILSFFINDNTPLE